MDLSPSPYSIWNQLQDPVPLQPCLVVGDAQIHEHPIHFLALKRFLHLTKGSMEDLET